VPRNRSLRLRLALALAVAPLLLAGCATSYEPGPLIDPGGWTEATVATDPFEDRPDLVDCAPEAWGEDLPGIFELETDECGYATFTQPTLVDVGPGATVELLGWHLDLFAVDPTEGHVVVRIGDVVLLEEHPTIPGQEAIWDLSMQWPDDAPEAEAGTAAWFHVHNHGANSYRLGAIEIVEE